VISVRTLVTVEKRIHEKEYLCLGKADTKNDSRRIINISRFGRVVIDFKSIINYIGPIDTNNIGQ